MPYAVNWPLPCTFLNTVCSLLPLHIEEFILQKKEMQAYAQQ